VICIKTGDPSLFALETGISSFYAEDGQQALGYMVMHVSGQSFGVRGPNATLLACSLDALEQRILKRGMHVLDIFEGRNARYIAESTHRAIYGDEDSADEELGKVIVDRNLLMAPDGDEAFDDGSHVLQVDMTDGSVMITAYRNLENADDRSASAVSITIDADYFYSTCTDHVEKFVKLRDLHGPGIISGGSIN
jgi:hypothetical protein